MNKKIGKAIYYLIEGNFFLNPRLISLIKLILPVEGKVETIFLDKDFRLYYNNDFINTLNIIQIEDLIIHELNHQYVQKELV